MLARDDQLPFKGKNNWETRKRVLEEEPAEINARNS
jgi:hypothetical protein